MLSFLLRIKLRVTVGRMTSYPMIGERNGKPHSSYAPPLKDARISGYATGYEKQEFTPSH